jgi:tetratricopeptide (TPR) repeat protein
MKLTARTIVSVVWFAAACGSQVQKPATPGSPTATGSMGHEHETSSAAPPAMTIDDLAKDASVLTDLGTYHRAITTSSPEAQTYFDQGLRLIYGFNHDEAARSFARATQLDPKCASCYWGVALVLGPNYNVPMLPDRFPAAWAALQHAQANAASATPVEQALIGALARRYAGPEPKDPVAMQPLQEAYAVAMTAVATKFPDDLDVQVLRAESLMDLNPWKLWTADGKPAPGPEDLVATLEKVLAKDPKHPGANHYYIHAVEASSHPEKAVASADRLPALIPGAGHIVHMPAHIYQRVGRYADASSANRKAADVDLGYMGKAPAWGYYAMYLVHNYGFLAFSASMEGRSAEALEAAQKSAKNFPPPMLEMMPGMDFFVSEPILVMVRFGKFDAILAMPRPDAKYPTLTSLWLHAHGIALASKGKLDEAVADLAELKKMAATISADASTGVNSEREVVAVSSAVLEAAIAQKRGDAKALELWAAAVAAEDHLSYSEPNDWFYPVRHYQGAALMAAKKYPEAEAVYRADLARNPNNGWGLWGLAQALKAENRTKDAAAAEAQWKKAWANADVQLTATAVLP